MGLRHFYHLYANGQWRDPADMHFAAARDSGLLDACTVHVGMVGTTDNVAKACDFLAERDVAFTICAQAESGWEQVTLDAILTTAQPGDLVCYAHTKGAGYPSDLARAWRHSMTYDVIVCWRDRVADLATYQASGPHWLKSREPEHAHHDYFFAGNYWWAQADYLLTLDKPGRETRFQAEGWIGLKHPTASSCRVGWSYWGNFYQGPLA